MKDVLIVHTPNAEKGLNYRFGKLYLGGYDNTDRLTIVGIPNESTKELSIGVAFCCYPDNFSREKGTNVAYNRAISYKSIYEKGNKPYAVVQLEDFTQENCLQVLYDLHAELVSKSVKEVKKLVNQQIVK